MTGAEVMTLIRGDRQAERAVPRAGITSWLVVLTTAALGFLAVFALALALTARHVATEWAADLTQTSTVRLSADSDLSVAMAILSQNTGVASARVLDLSEQQALLAPWLGPDLPLDLLQVPQLIEVIPADPGFDPAILRAQLAEAVPGAVLDDHTAWHAPLITQAERLRRLAWGAVLMLLATIVVIATLAAQAALAANTQTIAVLRLVGATDAYITRAFVRRFTLNSATSALCGTLAGFIGTVLLSGAANLLPGFGFPGIAALWLLMIPFLSGVAVFFATRLAAKRTLEETL